MAEVPEINFIHNYHKEVPMKTFIFSLAATTAVLVLGCQDPDMNNPVAIGDVVHRATTAKPAPTPHPNLIGFDQKITYTDPGVTSQVFQAVGSVTFRITKTSPSDDNLYDVQIVVNGEISASSSDAPAPRAASWTFQGSSKDRIRIPLGGKGVLAKTFVVAGASDPTILNMPITVTDRELAIGRMSLTKPVLASGNTR